MVITIKNDFLLTSKTAIQIYERIENLSIYDYHCHLSPEEIYKDEPFDNIGRLWLEHDHYKWRLMREYGIEEDKITGNASWHDKFIAYIQAVEFAAGNPLYHWSVMELYIYFGIDIPLIEKNAELIWTTANSVIKGRSLSPRKLLKQSSVKYIATTDDVCVSLEYHLALKEEKNTFTVAPSFRTDKLLLIKNDGYTKYLKNLSRLTEVKITDISSLKEAITQRLTFFKNIGCRFSDVGIPDFPNAIASESQADLIFKSALKGNEIDHKDYLSFLGYMYRFLGCLYRENDIVMQWHLAVSRNVNSNLFEKIGADSGGDCIGDVIPVKNITAILDSIEQENGLPETIIYTLNPSMLDTLASVAGSFRNVRVGAAWWFNDHRTGIRQTIETVAQTMHLGRFLGMLTDSRSFLSYARHDYFRRILCSIVGEWVEKQEFSGDYIKLCYDLCMGNIEKLIKGI